MEIIGLRLIFKVFENSKTKLQFRGCLQETRYDFKTVVLKLTWNKLLKKNWFSLDGRHP